MDLSQHHHPLTWFCLGKPLVRDLIKWHNNLPELRTFMIPSTCDLSD